MAGLLMFMGNTYFPQGEDKYAPFTLSAETARQSEMDNLEGLRCSDIFAMISKFSILWSLFLLSGYTVSMRDFLDFSSYTTGWALKAENLTVEDLVKITVYCTSRKW